ncbi:MAG: DUF302 domain-containing protein [Candidatus Limnocylindrales bacterium]
MYDSPCSTPQLGAAPRRAPPGACNPSLAHRALQADPSIGALLPCNVVLREDGAQTIIEAMDPRAVMGLVENAETEAVAAEAEERLRRVIGSLGAAD